MKVFRLDITPEQARALADELSRAADAGLFHPSIVEPIAGGVEGTVAYRAEEYVAAESLDVAMRHYAPAPLDKALPFLTQLAGALDFARAAGVGHGALHPRDIFVTPDEARATGFGVVEALERVGLRAPVRRPYSSPERIAGDAWGAPADVFSLAAIAYELLTARRPAGTGEHIGPMGSDGTTVGGQLHAVLARAMADDPARRYPGALAFVSALEAASRGELEPGGAPEPAAAAPLAAAAPAAAPPVAAAPLAAAMPPTAEPPTAPEAIEDDDIDVERDEDAAHHELIRAEQEREALEEPPSLFDEEAEADRFMAAAVAEIGHDDFEEDQQRRDIDSIRAAEEAAEVEEDAGSESYGEPVNAPVTAPSRGKRTPQPPGLLSVSAQGDEPVSRDGPRILPFAVTLIVGLLLGFAAGYGVASRDASDPAAAAPTPAAPAPQSTAGKEFSEQVVSPGSPPTAGAPDVRTSPRPAPSEPSGAAPPAQPDITPRDTAPPPAARPPAATTGRLLVRSTPSRAGVTVNGRWRGRTPLTLEQLPFANYTVRIVQPGYSVARENVALSPARPTRTLTFELQRSSAPAATRTTPRAAPPTDAARFTGSLYVDSRPRGARVLLDGRLIGTTPLSFPEVSAGSHVVRLELADHRPVSVSTRISAGRQERVTLSLERIQ